MSGRHASVPSWLRARVILMVAALAALSLAVVVLTRPEANDTSVRDTSAEAACQARVEAGEAEGFSAVKFTALQKAVRSARASSSQGLAAGVDAADGTREDVDAQLAFIDTWCQDNS